MHPVYPHPRPPKKLCITIVSNFAWVLTVVPREIDDNGYAFFLGGGGGTRCILVYVKMVNNNAAWLPTIDICTI